MNNTKSPKNVSLKNQLELWLFCALIGAVAGALVWILLKIMAVGTEFLWKWFPDLFSDYMYHSVGIVRDLSLYHLLLEKSEYTEYQQL